jgi:hypothetical protein
MNWFNSTNFKEIGTFLNNNKIPSWLKILFRFLNLTILVLVLKLLGHVLLKQSILSVFN